MLHINSPLAGQHIPHNWEYANAAARTGAVGFTSADLKKLALQTDDYSLWVLTAVTPTWVQVGGPSQTFTNVTVTGIETRTAVGEQELISQDASPFYECQQSTLLSGTAYSTNANLLIMKAWTHNFSINTSGNITTAVATDYCAAVFYSEDDKIKGFSSSSPVTAGVTPTLNLTWSIDNLTGKYTGQLLGSSTYSTLPAAASSVGQLYNVTDVGLNGSIWYTTGTRWYPVDSQIKLSQDAIPIGLPPGNGTNTGLQFTNATGAFTLTTTVFQNAYTGGIWLWMPIGAFDGTNPTSANFYWAVMSTTSAGQLYTATYQAGIPTGLVQATTTAARWLTQTTGADITARSITVVGGSMGPNGTLKTELLETHNNTAGAKTIKVKVGTTTISTQAPSTTVAGVFQSIIRNSGVQNINVVNTALTPGALISPNLWTAFDFSVNQTLSITLQLASNTDYSILEGSNLFLTPGF